MGNTFEQYLTTEVLQTGSVIEREFGYELIKMVTGLSEKELLSNLSVLKDSELLFERGVFPESTHIFKHALTREVVYESVLTKKKKKLHKEIGEAIEVRYRDSIDEHYAVLAEHFMEGESYEKGADYAKRAVKKARKDFAYRDAISYANKEVFCIERLPRTDAVQKKIIDARANLANYCMNLTRHIEAKEAVDPIADLALELNYKKSFPAIYNAIGTYISYVEEDFTEGVGYLNNAVRISTEIGDYYSLWAASMAWALIYPINANSKKVLKVLRNHWTWLLQQIIQMEYHLLKALYAIWFILIVENLISLFKKAKIHCRWPKKVVIYLPWGLLTLLMVIVVIVRDCLMKQRIVF